MQIDADLVEMVWGVATKFATPEVERPSQAKRRRRLANKRSAVERLLQLAKMPAREEPTLGRQTSEATSRDRVVTRGGLKQSCWA